MTTDTAERWRPIPGFENSYEISNHGHVRSLHRTIIRCDGRRYRVRERILKPQRVRPGSDMRKVFLAANGRKYCQLVHRLTAEVWGDMNRAINGSQINAEPQTLDSARGGG
jgi:hypothetical protein